MSIALLAFVFIGCVDTTTLTTPDATTPVVTTDNDPVIMGAGNITIEKNSTFVPLEGVYAVDAEDGILTSSIVYSGNVNPNATGTYTATYTVTDSDGNIAEVIRTVTVVLTDTVAPLLSGVGDITVLVGRPFDTLAGVSAVDTIDGVVAAQVTGTVNVWVPGVYPLVYTAKDAANNQTPAVTRNVTVGFGDFLFLTELPPVNLASFVVGTDTLTSPAFSGGVINTVLADFSYVKATITVTASAAGNIGIALGTAPSNYNELAVSATEATYVVYFIITAPLVDATVALDLNGLTLSALTMKIEFAEARDTVDPILNVPSDGFAFGVNGTAEALDAVLRTGVTAQDNNDGNISNEVAINLGTLDRTVVGVYDVVFSVTDSSNNTVSVTRQVTIGNLVDSGYITDPTFQTAGDGQWNEKSNDGVTDITYDPATGTMICSIINDGNWMSAAGTYLSKSTASFVVGEWYLFTFQVKSSYDRNMGFRMGLSTDAAHGWLDDYDGNSAGHSFAMTSEFQTYSIYFQLDSLTSSGNETTFKIELNLGDPNYGNKGTGTIVTFKDVYMYRVVTEYEDPTISENFGPAVDMPTTFKVGDTAPNWATYITAIDMSQNVLTPTIDASAVNMAAAGSYVIHYSVTDAHEKTATKDLTITVVEVANADVVGPVITINPILPNPLVFDQYANYPLDYTAFVSISDAVDGAITPTLAMVDNDGLDLNIAGVYNVVYTCYDKSGNETIATFVVTINDKQVPVIAVSNRTISMGELFNAKSGLIVTDNIDGTMSNDLVTIAGIDAFTDANGIVDTIGSFNVTYDVTDAAGNAAVQKTIVITVINIVWDTDKTITLTTPSETPYHCTLANDAVEEAAKISGISKDEWGSPARLVYYFTSTQLIKGQTYMFEIRVKAAAATTLGFRIGVALSADPWIDNFEGGLQTISITTEYVTYRVIFKINKDIPTGANKVKFQFQFGYLDTDTSNEIFVKSFKLVPEKQPIYLQVADLSPNDAFSGSVSGGSTIKGTDTLESAATISNMPAYTNDWSTSKLTYYFNTSILTYGETYRFVATMKTLTATNARLRIGTGLSADPWIDDFEGGSNQIISITTSYVTYYVYFTVNKTSFDASHSAKFEFSIGYGADTANILYVKDFIIEHVDASGEIAEITMFDAVSNLEGGSVSAPTYANAAAVQAALPTTLKAHYADVTVPVASWTDVDTYNPAVAGSYTFTAVLGTLPAGYANTANKTVSVEVFVGSATPSVSFNDFESYADTAAFRAAVDNINGVRLGAGTFVKDNGEILVIETNKVLSMGIAAGTNGIKINVTKAGLPASARYIAFWVKATDLTGIVKFQSFIYNAGGSFVEITNSLIGSFAKLGEGTMVYVPVSALQGDTTVLSLVLNCGSASAGKIYFDNIAVLDNAPANAAPVVSISEANLVALTGRIFTPGESLVAFIPTLLSMISINDAEDGVIAATAAMLNTYNFNVANPAVGSYNVSISCKDSNGKASNVVTICLNVGIGTVLENYNSYADTAAFLASSRLYGMRSGGNTMGKTNGALIGDETNKYARVNFLYSSNGMNGIQVNVSKDELVALGATYVGIYVLMNGTVKSGSQFQFYDYVGVASAFQQRTAYGSMTYASVGTYVWIKVSDLRAGVTMLSFQANVANGSTGTMCVDNLIWK